MVLEVKGMRVYENGRFVEKTLRASNGHIIPFSENDSVSASYDFSSRPSFIVIPGLTDVHVHFREPGMTIKDGRLEKS